MKENKLILGTVQLGLDYGIANKTGKPTEKQALEIMKYAVENGINYFDTAYSYGNSEIIIGKFLDLHKNYKNRINIITKMPSLKNKKTNEEIINEFFFSSLKRLRQESIYCYMVHDFNDMVKNCNVINKIFLKYTNEGLIKKIGVSIYDKSQIKFLLKNFDFDLIQIPINIFDQRLLMDDILVDLKKRGIEIYARSVFLQGLIFLDKYNLPSKFKSIKKQIEKLNDISLKFNISKEEVALLFVNAITEIDKIVIGIEKIEQLKRNIEIVNNFKNIHKMKTIINFKKFVIEDENIVDPRKWV
jgi:aryl-alcohol dehydrogenase-like predicted oxidoreductase